VHGGKEKIQAGRPGDQKDPSSAADRTLDNTDKCVARVAIALRNALSFPPVSSAWAVGLCSTASDLAPRELEMTMINAQKVMHRTIEVDGVDLFYREAGPQEAPGLLLLHGDLSSSFSFRNIMAPLAEVARVVAPDMPGFGGRTETPEDYELSFANVAETIDRFTQAIGIDRLFLYIHDYGSAVAYHLALSRPERVLGLIIQNGNAHEEGHGESWKDTKAYWADPTPANRAKLPDWLTQEGVCAEYLGGLPERQQPLVAPETWEIDSERLSRPGQVERQFRLFEDYASHVARFPEIAAYHREHQPPALLLWGRHDEYFAIEEVLAWHRALERINLHVLDGGHKLLETHHELCATLMRDFIRDVLAD
jgi:pimeloyl-ACP methyl ester carboxylesterase